MLGDLILQHTGKVTNNKVSDSKRPKTQASVVVNGRAKGGIDIAINITYWNIQCDGGLYYGEGKGEITDKDGKDIVKVTEYGIGKSEGHKIMWRGSAFYQTSPLSSKLYFLHGIVGVFETEVEKDSGFVAEKIWEWR